MMGIVRGQGSRGGSGRPITVIGAPSSIGIRPYEEGGEPRALHRAPGALRALGLVERLGADDAGDVTPPPYRDVTRPPSRPRNEEAVVAYSRSLAEQVAEAAGAGRFTLVLGGDCSIVLGSLLGASRVARKLGLAYVDGHADFATPEESVTGSVASMCLAMAVGRGDSPLSALAGANPLVRGENTAVIGRRDVDQPGYGNDAIAPAGLLDVPYATVSEIGARATAERVLDRIGGADLDGFWIHIDADVLDPRVMPAVDSPEPGGPGIDELAELVAPLASHPAALGMQITIYDPALDEDGSCARRLVDLLGKIFANGTGGGGR